MRTIDHRTFHFIALVRLTRRNLHPETLDRHVPNAPRWRFLIPVTQPHKQRIARIGSHNVLHPDVLQYASIHRFKRYRRSISIIDLHTADLDMPEPATGCRTKLDPAGTA